MSLSLYDIGQEWLDLESALMDSGGEITEELEERIAELMTSETNKVNGYLAVRANLKMVQEGAKAEADRLAAKSKAAANAITRMESRLLNHMTLRGETEINADLGKVKVMRAAAPIEITGDVPEEFQKVTVTVDKAGIKQALKDGELPFAKFGEPTKYLRVF